MKLFGRKNFLMLGLIILGTGQFSHAEQFTKVQALQVLNVLMSANKITNTYGGKYSTVINDMRNSTIQIYRNGNKFEIMLQPYAPAITIKNISVDGLPLETLLKQ